MKMIRKMTEIMKGNGSNVHHACLPCISSCRAAHLCLLQKTIKGSISNLGYWLMRMWHFLPPVCHRCLLVPAAENDEGEYISLMILAAVDMRGKNILHYVGGHGSDSAAIVGLRRRTQMLKHNLTAHSSVLLLYCLH